MAGYKKMNNPKQAMMKDSGEAEDRGSSAGMDRDEYARCERMFPGKCPEEAMHLKGSPKKGPKS